MNEIINLGNGAKVKVTMLKGEAGNDIQSVEKTATQGLVDTYTITLTDGTTHNFNVTNGRAITSIEKTSSVGFVDTYTITFNDGTTETFEVETATITVDSALSTTSTNPVENRVIATKVNDIESDIDAVDTKADDNSTKINNVQSQLIQLSSIESTSTASQSYNVGDYLVLNGQLRKVTNAIAQGNTINSTNSESVTVTDDMKIINTLFNTQIGKLHFLFASVVRTLHSGTDSFNLFTNSELNTMLGVNNSNNLNTIVIAVNGDGNANNLHMGAPTYLNDTESWHVTFSSNAGTVTYTTRVNTLIVYSE